MSASPIARLVRREGWVLGLFALLALLLVATRHIQPDYGAAGFGSLVRAVLPFAFAVAAQTVVVIAGGVDLSIASMMALTSVTAATLMEGASEEFALLVVPLVLLLGLALGAINGALIVITRVPDIVVTLSMLFVWQGAALLVLEAPGGGSAQWLMELADRNCADSRDSRGDHRFHPEGACPARRLPRHRLDPAPPLAARPRRSTPSAATASQRSGAACR